MNWFGVIINPITSTFLGVISIVVNLMISSRVYWTVWILWARFKKTEHLMGDKPEFESCLPGWSWRSHSFLSISLLTKFTLKTLKLYYHFTYFSYYKHILSVRLIIIMFRAPNICSTREKKWVSNCGGWNCHTLSDVCNFTLICSLPKKSYLPIWFLHILQYSAHSFIHSLTSI